MADLFKAEAVDVEAIKTAASKMNVETIAGSEVLGLIASSLEGKDAKAKETACYLFGALAEAHKGGIVPFLQPSFGLVVEAAVRRE